VELGPAYPDNVGVAKRLTLKYLKEEEIEALFRAITSKRDTAMFRLAYHRGLRASEIGMLQMGDYRKDAGRLYVRRLKGSRAGEYRLTAVEQSSLRAWIRERGPAPGPLFPSRNHRPISRYMLDDLMKRYCAAAGIPRERAHMHALKHSCGTHLAGELDVQLVQDHLGHADIRSTMVYVQITNRARDAVAERLKDWGKR
jgi:integrase